MKKVLLTIASIVMMSALTAQAAEDRIEKPLWDCALSFQADGGGIQFLVGSFKLTGPGKIRCIDVAGNHQELPVKVTMGSTPIAPNFAIGHFHIAGIASGIGVATGPEALLGTYYNVGGEAAVAIGVGANLALHGAKNALTLNLGINVLTGAGFQVGLNRVKIEAL